MSTAEIKTRYTPEDLLTLPDGKRYELVDGQLAELNVSMWSSYVAGVIFRLLSIHCLGHRLGWPFPEGTSFQCFAAFPQMVRKPDVSFIRLDRLTIQQAQAEGHCPVVPDFAVEVVSPNDTVYELAQKVRLYLNTGVPLVWVVNPEDHTVGVHRATGPGTILRENDEVTGENVIPVFRSRVGDFFLPPDGAIAGQP